MFHVQILKHLARLVNYYLCSVDMETVQEEVICQVSQKLRMEPEFLLLLVPYSLNDTIFLK